MESFTHFHSMKLPYHPMDAYWQNWFARQMINDVQHAINWMLTMNRDARHECEYGWVKSSSPEPRGMIPPSVGNPSNYYVTLKNVRPTKIDCGYLRDLLLYAHKFRIPRSVPIFSLRSLCQHSFRVCIVRTFLVLDSNVSLDMHQLRLDTYCSNAFRSILHRNNLHKPVAQW